MIIFFLIQFLWEKRNDIDIRTIFDINHHIDYLLFVFIVEYDLNGLDGCQELSDSVVDGGKGDFVSLEGLQSDEEYLSDKLIWVDDLFVLNIL